MNEPRMQSRSRCIRVLRSCSAILIVCLIACAEQGGEGASPTYSSTELKLPGATGLVTLDYFAYDGERLWVPASNLGTVDVINGTTDEISSVEGFRTAEVELRGRKLRFGPSSISIGDGVVYVGSRADSSICPIDARTMKLGDCVKIAEQSSGLAAQPDAVVYIPTTREVWVTTGAPPLGIAAAERSILILDASPPNALKQKTKLVLGASAEGYAVDKKRGIFYTSLEERGETLAIDVRKRTVISRWHSGCDEPHGLAFDSERQFLFVACSNRVIELDTAHGGKVLGSIDTGEGLDNIDYSESENTVYAAAATAAKLTVIKVDDRGHLTASATVPTALGARCVVAGSKGTAYVADPNRGRILKIRRN